MFHSVKLKSTFVTIVSFACVIIFVLICLISLRGGLPAKVNVGGEQFSLRAQNEEDIAALLTVCGYENAELLSERGITVPKHWNETYTQYNDLQRAQGLDLTSYKGKTATERIYSISDDDDLTLLIADGRVIAAHICHTDGTGMRPLFTESSKES